MRKFTGARDESGIRYGSAYRRRDAAPGMREEGTMNHLTNQYVMLRDEKRWIGCKALPVSVKGLMYFTE